MNIAAAVSLLLVLGTRGETPVKPMAKDVKDSKDSGAVVIKNAKIWGHPKATTIVFAGDKIVKVGGDELVAYTAAHTIDAHGGVVVPGFHDAHIHMLSGGRSLAQAQLASATTLDDTLKLVKQYADSHKDAPWILGRGWSYDIVPKGKMPTAKMLDAVTGDRPAALEAYDGHTMWVNSKALALAKVTKATKDPADGTVARDKDGNPEGALLENAEELVDPVIPEMTRAQKKDALALAARECAKLGITGVDAIEAGVDEWDILKELDGEGKLPIRVNVILPIEGDMDAYVKMRAAPSAKVKLIGVKGFVDGVVESKTAYMLKPYDGCTGDQCVGRPLIPPDKLDVLVREATKRNLMVALHSIGDAAVRESLDAYEKNHAKGGRIEHIEVLDKADVARFKKTGTIASMQPYHSIPGEPDPDAGAWSENLGPERRKMTFAWKTLLDAGAQMTFGSDWPVFTNDPLQGLAVAVTRQTEHGVPKGGWNIHQAITMDQAIANYAEGRTLDEGQPADLVLLPPSIDLKDAHTLWGKAPSMVVVGGTAVAGDVKP
jgi:predicted amidohydrolase YtcJ